ncbi:MAG: hypothetical protein VX910_11170 [Candidatus Latescibacterota bacterium]|nr:hypothetical protein [Candidatus Latescibacterota bacterium]
MKDLETFPFDYALYFSPDHHRGEGGIWLYVCNGDPTDSTNYLSYENAIAAGYFDHISSKPESNPIHLDNVQGEGHTETPHANVVDGVVHMTYHKNGIECTQRTMLATSTDGVNFERLNGREDSVVLTYDVETDVGDGHTGYFRWSKNPFPGISQKYVGYSLHGGGDNYHSAIWASDDAKSWKRLDILKPIEGFAVDQEDMILIWHEIDPASIRPLGNGEFIAITGIGNRASGGVKRLTELYEIFLAEDGRTITRQSRKILGVGAENEPDTEELSSPTSVIIDGVTYLVYVGATSGGTENTVLAATGNMDDSTPNSPVLSAKIQHQHIHQP